MSAQPNDFRRAHERHSQLLTEARIQRLLREARAAQSGAPNRPERRESLVARIYGQLRQRRVART